jgi:5-formyltetrahydrofolate cyclo-ligase
LDKRALREETLRDFASLTPEQRISASESIAERVLELPELEKPTAMMLFLSMDDELDTGPLVCGALEAGHRVYAPHTLRKERKMIPTRVDSLSDISCGAYGIREPAGDTAVQPEQLGFVVVPAVAFDRAGNRLGRGGGFYDRFIERLAPDAVTCGVIFSRHLLNEVPTEPHDRRVMLVVTEHETVRM